MISPMPMKVIVSTLIHVIVIFWLTVIINKPIFAQDTILNWRAYYGGEGLEEAKSIRQLSGGGYIMAGSTDSRSGDITQSFGRKDAWALRLDPNGQLIWQLSLGGRNDDEASSITIGQDGRYGLAGYTTFSRKNKDNNHGGKDVLFALIDINGKPIRQTCFGGSEAEAANSIQSTADGGYILAGYTFSNDGQVSGNHGKQDAWVIKLNAAGELVWQHCYGGSANDEATDIKETYSGDFVITGHTYSRDGDITENKGKSDYWVFVIDTAGNILGQRTLGGSGNDKAAAITPTFDGGYAIGGSTTSSDGDVSGYHGMEDFWVVKLNPEGTIEWQHAFGGNKDDVATALVQTLDGGFGVGGYTYSFYEDINENSGKCDFWILKLDSSGKMEWESSLGDKNWEVANCLEATADYGLIIAGYSESREKDFSTFENTGDVNLDNGQNDCCGTGIIWAGALIYDLLKPRLVFRDIWVVKF